MIYFIQAEGIGHIKIGFTDKDDAALRLAELQTGSSATLRLLGVSPGDVLAEKNLHRRFAAARVHGEWFRPVPELLQFISSPERTACGATEIAERSVSIRVLTVGRKQFTRSLLDQLPAVEFIDWRETMSCFRDDRELLGQTWADYLSQASLTPFIRGTVWGWVCGGEEKSEVWDAYENRYLKWHHSFRWVVGVQDGALAKSKDFDDSNSVFRGIRLPPDGFHEAYPLRLLTPGWRPEDQLFYGV